MNGALMTGARIAIVALMAALTVGCSGLGRPAHEERDQPVTEEDLRILQRAGELLPDEAHWNRQDTRECPAGELALSLFCALQKASIEVLGEYQHRRVALQEVRFAIEEVSGGREFEHRLMDFNNLPSTTLADVKRVLAIAEERVRQRLAKASG